MAYSRAVCPYISRASSSFREASHSRSALTQPGRHSWTTRVRAAAVKNVCARATILNYMRRVASVNCMCKGNTFELHRSRLHICNVNKSLDMLWLLHPLCWHTSPAYVKAVVFSSSGRVGKSGWPMKACGAAGRKTRTAQSIGYGMATTFVFLHKCEMLWHRCSMAPTGIRHA